MKIETLRGRQCKLEAAWRGIKSGQRAAQPEDGNGEKTREDQRVKFPEKYAANEGAPDDTLLTEAGLISY
jgi:hypothetical protein